MFQSRVPRAVRLMSDAPGSLAVMPQLKMLRETFQNQKTLSKRQLTVQLQIFSLSTSELDAA